MRLTILAILFASSILGSCRHQAPIEEATVMSAVPETSCPLPVSCNASLPILPESQGFEQKTNKAMAELKKPSHRARDVIAVLDQEVWVIGKFTYGYLDSNLIGEMVDVYLSRSCGGPMQKIAETRTTKAKQHKTVDGVADDGGRVYVELKKLGINLGVGRHKIVLVVRADQSQAEMFVDVVPKDAKFVVTDVDGVLTAGEYTSATEVYKDLPEARPGSAEALNALYNKGYHILYLTARAEWFTAATRKWLDAKSFPPGSVQTTSSVIGATGAAAHRFKAKALAALKARTGIVPTYAFGSKESDVKAFMSAGITPEQSFFWEMDEQKVAGGSIHSDYLQLSKSFNVKESLCPQ